MGRYYQGDIEGKFWFAVQNSNDADFFGVTGEEPSELEYCFDKDNLKSIKEGIKTCNTKLGKYKKLIEEFFKEKNSYNNEGLAKYLKISVEKVGDILEWYARLELGEKILKCVEENDCCQFTAEL